MDLFETEYSKSQPQNRNLLPRDGNAQYVGTIFSQAESFRLMESLSSEIPWQNDEVIMFGKRIITRRMTAWYGDQPWPYTYSKVTRKALQWNDLLLEIKEKVEQESGTNFNSCLLNFYHDGDDGMGWHSDNEKTLIRNAPIASLSLGATRKFAFKHRETSEKVEIMLENGSLLLMLDETQQHWVHTLLKSKKVQNPRVNLTFRCFDASFL